MSKFVLACLVLLFISGCNSVDRFQILKQCTVLGDESIVYARAHYVKLFYHFNPEKFAESYKQISDFDAITLRNTIDTYTRAVDKISSKGVKANDTATQNLISACKELSAFSKDFVENTYKQALDYQSESNPLSDEFFIEINQLVKFDHKIGVYDKSRNSFKRSVEQYKEAVKNYIQEYRKSIPSKFINNRKN